MACRFPRRLLGPCCRWCEHDPLEIWDSVLHSVEGALAAARAAVGDVRVVALGLTNQRETTLAWDRDSGRPLHNAIVWHDSRTAAVCRRTAEELGAVRCPLCACRHVVPAGAGACQPRLLVVRRR